MPVLALLLVALPSCGRDTPASPSASGACGPDTTEALDPASTQHLLPGATEPAYASDPPTSGAHELGTLPSGVLSAPVRRPVQVTILEEGGVLLQHRDLADDDRRALESLAGRRIVVAPNPGLASPVVATAWRHKMSCQRVDTDSLAEFIETHEGRGAEG